MAATAELRAANERLQELDRMKDDFVSTVTHELRTPLTSIRAFSEILHDKPDLAVEERQRFLSIVIQESERLTRLINQVLDLAKLESGRAEWQVGDVDVKSVVEDSVAATSQLFGGKDVALTVDVRAGPAAGARRSRPPRAGADQPAVQRGEVRRVPAAVASRVRVATEGRDVTVRVTDNGPGVAPADQRMIFEKFRQAGDTLTEKPQGTGLGLPISRQIVEHLGGRLWVESVPGQGATFAFALPAVGGRAARARTDDRGA